MKRDRAEIERMQSKINARYEAIEKKEHDNDDLKRELQQKERNLSRTEDILRANEAKLKAVYTELIAKLERISSYDQR